MGEYPLRVYIVNKLYYLIGRGGFQKIKQDFRQIFVPILYYAISENI